MAGDSQWASYLQRIPIFASLQTSQLEAVASICTHRRIKKGQILFHEGSDGYEMFVILSGKLRIESCSSDGQPVVIATRTTKEVIGEMAILEKMPRSATVTADVDSRLLVIHQDDFNRLLGTTPQLALSMLKHLSSRVREVSIALLGSRSESLRNRVLEYVISQPVVDGQVELTWTQGEIAQELGCTREALSRNLKQLCAEGKLRRLGRSRYEIRS
jgi:CRP/FNR family transcriptional regulator, cyclic AMP receptor protein